MNGEMTKSQILEPVKDTGDSVSTDMSSIAQLRPCSGHDQPDPKKGAALPSGPNDMLSEASLIEWSSLQFGLSDVTLLGRSIKKRTSTRHPVSGAGLLQSSKAAFSKIRI